MTPSLGPATTRQRAVAPEHELILRLVGTAARRRAGAERVAALAERVDADRLTLLLEDQRLTAIAGTRLVKVAGGRLPTGFAARVDDCVQAGRRRADVFTRVSASIVKRLEHEGVRCVSLKGPRLARKAHGDAGLRHCSDVDLLVKPEALELAARVIESCGYRRLDDVEWVAGRPHLHHAFVPAVSWLPPIDLHWRIHWYETAFSRRLVERSRPYAGGGRRPSHTDELAALLLFFERDSFFGLRYAADLAGWWDAHVAHLPASPLDPVMEEHPELRQALLSSAIVADRLVGVPVDRLVSARWRVARRARLATRLANWTRDGDDRAASTTMSMVDCLLAPRGGGREFLRRYSFQPAAVFAEAHQLPPQARVRPALWRMAHGLVRSARMAAAYACTAWSLRGGRHCVPVPTAEPTR
jgi:hypothetical protein